MMLTAFCALKEHITKTCAYLQMVLVSSTVSVLLCMEIFRKVATTEAAFAIASLMTGTYIGMTQPPFHTVHSFSQLNSTEVK